MERIPKQGEFYRHFKNRLYQVIAVAQHSETGESMVVYQALYGNFGIYVRPLDMFISEVDRIKYPDERQKYRFELVEPGQENQQNQENQELCVNPWLIKFLEAESYGEKLKLLADMEGNVGQKELESICVALDIPETEGTVEEQLYAIEKYLMMQKKYDGERLR